MSTLHPLETVKAIKESYVRYLKTIYPFQDQALRTAFAQEISRPNMLVKGPLLEAAPPFKQGYSIAALVEDGVLHPSFQSLCSDALPWERPLYLHQEQAIRHIVQQQRNVIVATGTGSGKTESFLLPILNHLLQEEADGTLGEPGVRALLLYPMNALANDQLKRLRRLLQDFPSITFGRYTGENEKEDGPAQGRFYEQFPQEPLLPNELLSRKRMRATPPHILLTNYAMLEYLLLRPKDCELFDGGTGKHWRFLVLDEAHIYDGASGIELAMLLRRLKDRVVQSQPGRLHCIATSATLGRGREDFPAAATFARHLFNEPFEWEPHNPLRQDVIEATRVSVASYGDEWGEGSYTLYHDLVNAVREVTEEKYPLNESVQILYDAAFGLVPSTIIEEAKLHALAEVSDPDHQSVLCDVFLYYLLRGDLRLHRLHQALCAQPYALEEIAPFLFPDERVRANDALIALVNLAVRARPTVENLSLLPARYHAFARALEGVFACLNSAAHMDKRPHLFLQRHTHCPDCDSLVVELATCTRCGASYLVSSKDPEQHIHDHDAPTYLRPLQENDRLEGKQLVYYLIQSDVGHTDEDELIVVGEELSDEGLSSHMYTLCLQCSLLSSVAERTCDCNAAQIHLHALQLKRGEEPRHCICQ